MNDQDWLMKLWLWETEAHLRKITQTIYTDTSQDVWEIITAYRLEEDKLCKKEIIVNIEQDIRNEPKSDKSIV